MQPAAAAHPRQLMRQKMNLLGALMEDPQFTARNDGQPHRRPTGRGNHSRGNVLLRGPQPSDTWTTAESPVEVLRKWDQELEAGLGRTVPRSHAAFPGQSCGQSTLKAVAPKRSRQEQGSPERRSRLRCFRPFEAFCSLTPRGSSDSIHLWGECSEEVSRRIGRNTWESFADELLLTPLTRQGQFCGDLNGKSLSGHPPYSPDWAPCHFFSSSGLKNSLEGTHLSSVDNIRKTAPAC